MANVSNSDALDSLLIENKALQKIVSVLTPLTCEVQNRIVGRLFDAIEESDKNVTSNTITR